MIKSIIYKDGEAESINYNAIWTAMLYEFIKLKKNFDELKDRYDRLMEFMKNNKCLQYVE